jgi:Holliday junction resolvase RusA-like endonuclease
VIQSFFVPGPLPSLNELLGAKRNGRGTRQDAYGKLKKRWAHDVQTSALVRGIKPVNAAKIRFIWHEKDRRRDPDNISGGGQKLVLDALVKAGILPNDGWNQVLQLDHVFIVDKESPGVTIILSSPS